MILYLYMKPPGWCVPIHRECLLATEGTRAALLSGWGQCLSVQSTGSSVGSRCSLKHRKRHLLPTDLLLISLSLWNSFFFFSFFKLILKIAWRLWFLVFGWLFFFIRVYFPSYFRSLWLLVCASVFTRLLVPGEQAYPIHPVGTSEDLCGLLLWKPYPPSKHMQSHPQYVNIY